VIADSVLLGLARDHDQGLTAEALAGAEALRYDWLDVVTDSVLTN